MEVQCWIWCNLFEITNRTTSGSSGWDSLLLITTTAMTIDCLVWGCAYWVELQWTLKQQLQLQGWGLRPAAGLYLLWLYYCRSLSQFQKECATSITLGKTNRPFQKGRFTTQLRLYCFLVCCHFWWQWYDDDPQNTDQLKEGEFLWPCQVSINW